MTVTPWTPCRVGAVDLQHRAVLAPLTRARASLSTRYPGTYLPNALIEQYYVERATPGGLLISEACPVSQRASGRPGIPGWFTPEQTEAWASIVTAVHAKGAIFFTQLWHQGRNTHSSFAGQQPESSSAIPINGNVNRAGFPPTPYETPLAMTYDEIQCTQEDFVEAAVFARKAGCDGIEIHAANGYLFDQFHHSNVNQRDDQYGGSAHRRCAFTLETVDKLCQEIGSDRVAVRLCPFGLFNDTRGEERVEQWTYLCAELAKQNLAYVHMIEPRFDEFRNASEKAATLVNMSAGEVSLRPFRQALGSTPMISAGGHDPSEFEEGLSNLDHDLVAFGRFFCANPDLVNRLRDKQPLYKWDRSRFYGPFEDNDIGYTVFPWRQFAVAGDAQSAQLAD